MATLITDAELLAMGIASTALASITSGTRDQARAAASDLALSYVAKRYKLPLVSWGNDLRRAVAHIAAYDLLCARGFNPAAGSDDSIKQRHDTAVSWLRDVSRGIAELVDCVDSTPTLEEQGPLTSTSDGGSQWGDYGSDTGWGR